MEPQNDCFIEMDFNGEARVMLGLLGKTQPDYDTSFHAKEVFSAAYDPRKLKQMFFPGFTEQRRSKTLQGKDFR